MVDSMGSKGFSPDVVTFNTLINGYCTVGRVGDGLELFCEMGRRGIVANAITYRTLIHGFCQVGNINGALDIFQEMISSGVNPDTITIRNMLTSLWSKEELKRAVAMLEDLQMSMLCKSYVFLNIKKNVYMLLCVADRLKKVYYRKGRGKGALEE